TVTNGRENRMELATVSLSDRLRTAAATRGEEFLAEVPTTVRRLGLLFVVLAVSVPTFLACCVVGMPCGLLAQCLRRGGSFVTCLRLVDSSIAPLREGFQPLRAALQTLFGIARGGRGEGVAEFELAVPAS